MDMAYKRQISYMDLMENESKRGNAGFIKWEKYDECHILSVFVNGLEQSCSREAEVLLGNGHSIGRLNIKNGRAEGTYLLTKGEKDWIAEIERIQIPLQEEKELVAVFAEEAALKEEEKEKMPEIANTNEKKDDVLSNVLERMEESQPEPIEKTNELQKVEIEESEKEKSFWEKMSETHELIYPFGNNIGCYRIFPKDINLLHANYHALQNNQFLMHGYYNYRHLIIWPKKESENEFWLGVPGIYHEREKMAARMFGFEKFEGTKKEYRVGDLGYYLITVEG